MIQNQINLLFAQLKVLNSQYQQLLKLYIFRFKKESLNYIVINFFLCMILQKHLIFDRKHHNIKEW